MELVADLGHGDFGDVYEVRRQGVSYAVKVLRLPGDRATLVAARREAALLSCVNHPGLARIHEVGEIGGRPYLAMDLIDGVPLSELLQDGHLSEADLLTLGRDVAQTLAAAHRTGVVHRDIKPDNILITPGRRAKVIDFGLATHSARRSRPEGIVAGTLAYTAPEQSGMLNRPVDGRSDLYSLGAVLFEAAAGSPPFVADDPSLLLRLHLLTDPPDLASVRPDLSASLVGVVLRLLAKDPDNRYQTADALAAEFDRLITDRPADIGPGQPDSPVPRRPDRPLIGRTAEREALDASWRRARAGDGNVVLVHGAPGRGKSRLVQVLLDRARDEGDTVLEGTCRPDGLPMAGVRSALDDHATWVGTLDGHDLWTARDRLTRACAHAPERLGELSPRLAALLDLDVTTDQTSTPTATDVASLILELARAAGGAILHLDDAQWLDSASMAVLSMLADALPSAPVVVVLTSSDQAVGAPFAELVNGLPLPTKIDIGPLSGAESIQLVTTHLAGAQVTPDLAARLAAMGAGNPGATLAYLDAVVDAGLLHPAWGSWVLDEAGLEALALPVGLLDLTVRRVAALSERTRTVLAAAAVLGQRFDPELVCEIISIDIAQVMTALVEAVESRLVEPTDAGRYAFVHHGVQDAVTTGTGECVRHRLHRRAALVRAARLDLTGLYGAAAQHILCRNGPVAVLFQGRKVPSAEVYAVARHCVHGSGGDTPDLPDDMVFRATRAAGALALAEHAPHEAVTFFDQAHGSGTDEQVDGLLWELTAIAYLRDGRLAEARRRFATALDHEDDRWRRIRLHLRLSQVALALLDTAGCLHAISEALRESGRPLCDSQGRTSFGGMRTAMTGILRSRFDPRRRPDDGQLADHRALAMLYCVGMSVYQVSPRRATALYRRARPLAARLRGSPEVLIMDSCREITAVQLDQKRLRRRLGNRLAHVQLDAYGASTLAIRRALAAVLADEDPRLEQLAATLVEHGRVIHIGDLLLSSTTLLAELALRGRATELLTWHERIADQAHLDTPDQRESPFLRLAAAAHAALGNRAEAARQQRELASASAREPAGSLLHLRLIAARLHTAWERGNAGTEGEDAAAELVALFPRAEEIPLSHVDCWVWYTHTRLRRRTRSAEEQHPALLDEAERAVATLASLARTRLVRAHHRVALARLSLLRGDLPAAVGHATAAEALAHMVDAPLVLFEAAHVRSHALRQLGHHASAERSAGCALVVAEQQGWVSRIRSLQRTFRVDGTKAVRSAGGTRFTAGEGTDLNARRLAALQQVSLAAATVLEPHQLARVALDETQRILAAERALLFLLPEIARERPHGPEGIRDALGVPGDLVPYLGRSGGQDLPEVSDYSTTLVTRVAVTGQPLVVTGSAHGAALGSHSALVHDLRSILVAPLHLKDRLIGVVYLDSRVASGIFTDDDVDILLAITHHVGVALETARAARLEADVRVARRERDLAEFLRSSLIRLSTQHDAAEILDETLRAVAEVLGCDAFLVWETSGRMTVAAQVGETSPTARVFDPGEVGVPWQGAVTPVRASDAASVVLPGLVATDWIALPLVLRGIRLGTIVAVSQGPRLEDARADVAATLIEQSLVAYQNAHLVTRLGHLAAMDELTGVLNRRRFFEVAAPLVAGARSRGEPTGAIMLDIDHFKQFNDRYGHAVGDEVLVEVTARLRAVVRPEDVLGRYGGEEFALVLSRPSAEAVALAHRLRAVVSDSPVRTTSGPLPVTISVGVAVARPQDTTVEDLLSRADAALYEAKGAGRDRVALAPT